MRNRSHENEFDLHENEAVGGTHFHMEGFVLGLVLIQRHEGTRKWPIECRKTKTKVITLANQKGHRQFSEPIKTPSNVADAKRGKMSARESRLVLALHLIGCKTNYFRHSNEKSTLARLI